MSSLIPAEVEVGEAPSGSTTFVDLPVGTIEPNRNQPRQDFDEETLAMLTASVREVGILQPVLVRPVDEGRYELIAGERRWRAAHRAGLTHIPALVRVLDDTSSLEQAVVENLHRTDLGPLEEAAAYQQLIEEFGLTHEQVATKVGKSRTAITNALRLFQLPSSIQKHLADGQLTAGHAKALLGTPDRAFQEYLAKRCIREALSVRDVEDAVRARAELEQEAPDGGVETAFPAARKPSRSRQRDPGLLELEALLADFLETRVAIQGTGGRGRVVIEYADLEDLERIYRRIAIGPPVSTPLPSDSDDEPSGEAARST